MSTPDIRLVLATVAGAFLAVGLLPLATSPVAHAVCASEDASPACDTDFISNTINLGFLSETVAADPGDAEYVAIVLKTPLFTDVLTSGADPSDSVGYGAAGVGLPGETVNTFESPFFPFLDSTTVLPFTDPIAPIFTALIPFGF